MALLHTVMQGAQIIRAGKHLCLHITVHICKMHPSWYKFQDVMTSGTIALGMLSGTAVGVPDSKTLLAICIEVALLFYI